MKTKEEKVGVLIKVTLVITIIGFFVAVLFPIIWHFIKN